MAFGATELILIILAVIFLFGGKKFLDWIEKIKHAKKELSKSEDKPKKEKKSLKKKVTKVTTKKNTPSKSNKKSKL